MRTLPTFDLHNLCGAPVDGYVMLYEYLTSYFAYEKPLNFFSTALFFYRPVNISELINEGHSDMIGWDSDWELLTVAQPHPSWSQCIVATVATDAPNRLADACAGRRRDRRSPSGWQVFVGNQTTAQDRCLKTMPGSHTSRQTVQTLASLGFTVLRQPPYLSDLAASDCAVWHEGSVSCRAVVSTALRDRFGASMWKLPERRQQWQQCTDLSTECVVCWGVAVPLSAALSLYLRWVPVISERPS
jgi:hypothetical protein